MQQIGKATVALLVVGFILALFFGISWLSAVNRDADLRNRFAAQQTANEASFDTMWKIVQEKGSIADKYKDAFKEIFKDLIAGRSTGAGALGKFLVESNPKFDASLFKSVMASVEGERRRFFKDQQLLLDIKREHDNLRTRFPSRLFVGGGTPLDPVIVTSDKTADVFRTGRENLDDKKK